MAEDTKERANRLILMEMAHSWLLLADLAEKNSQADLTEQPQPK